MSQNEKSTFELLLAQSMEELAIKTASHDRLWQISAADWSVAQESGQIVFHSPKSMIATAPVQIIGTYNSQNNTWLWGWDHPSVVLPLRKHAEQLRDYGKKNKLPRLTERLIKCTQDECWEFAALACRLCEAQGAYCGPDGDTLVFMTFGDVALSKA